VALIALLAQVGAYVPADEVQLGICDQIFTRLATSDNISESHSTYMVEMLETSEIIRLGTKRSLVSSVFLFLFLLLLLFFRTGVNDGCCCDRLS
jgi:dsDNA-specific endonuclease/ATPase MutS2